MIDIEANNFIERDIQKQLKYWKNNYSSKVLKLDGARQLGKTVELLKFGHRNYKKVTYIDLSNELKELNKANSIKEKEAYCADYIVNNFEDSKDTLLIIDEIQESSIFYNSVIEMRQELKCDIAISGSRLAQVLYKSEFIKDENLIYRMEIKPLSLQEFSRALNLDEKASEEIYRQIGGYPEVIKKYIETRNINECHKVIKNILEIYSSEYTYYIDDTSVLTFDLRCEDELYNICKLGYDKYVESIIIDNNKLDILNNIINVGVVVKNGSRLHMIDIGIANYICKKYSIDNEQFLSDTYNRIRSL